VKAGQPPSSPHTLPIAPQAAQDGARHQSLARLEVAFEEQSLLRMGLVARDAVYTEIDLAPSRSQSICLPECVDEKSHDWRENSSNSVPPRVTLLRDV
jgi:hypothetical protein